MKLQSEVADIFKTVYKFFQKGHVNFYHKQFIQKWLSYCTPYSNEDNCLLSCNFKRPKIIRYYILVSICISLILRVLRLNTQ